MNRLALRPAERYGLAAKGRIALGADADLCLFDPEGFRPVGTYAESPAAPPRGWTGSSWAAAPSCGRGGGPGSGPAASSAAEGWESRPKGRLFPKNLPFCRIHPPGGMLYYSIMHHAVPAFAGDGERERSPLKKLAKRKPEPQTEAPQRIPWPDYAPGAESGLTAAQAAELLSGGWGNEAVASPTKSDKQIIRENVFTYFNLIFVVLAVCLLLVGDWKDMTFLLIVAANAGHRHRPAAASPSGPSRSCPCSPRPRSAPSGTGGSRSCPQPRAGAGAT